MFDRQIQSSRWVLDKAMIVFFVNVFLDNPNEIFKDFDPGKKPKPKIWVELTGFLFCRNSTFTETQTRADAKIRAAFDVDKMLTCGGL